MIGARFRATTVTLNILAGAWGLVNFGILLWMPADLRVRGYSVAGSNELLFYSSIVALPTTIFVAFLYSRWSTKWSLVFLTVLTAFGLLGVSMFDSSIGIFRTHPLIVFSALMVGVNGIIAVLLPYTAENYPVLVRGALRDWYPAAASSAVLPPTRSLWPHWLQAWYLQPLLSSLPSPFRPAWLRVMAKKHAIVTWSSDRVKMVAASIRPSLFLAIGVSPRSHTPTRMLHGLIRIAVCRSFNYINLLVLALVFISSGCDRGPSLPDPSSSEYKRVVRAFYAGLTALQVGDDDRADTSFAVVTRVASAKRRRLGRLG